MVRVLCFSPFRKSSAYGSLNPFESIAASPFARLTAVAHTHKQQQSDAQRSSEQKEGRVELVGGSCEDDKPVTFAVAVIPSQRHTKEKEKRARQESVGTNDTIRKKKERKREHGE